MESPHTKWITWHKTAHSECITNLEQRLQHQHQLLAASLSLICSGLASSRRKDDTNNEAIQGQGLSEDENKNHSNKKLWLLSICSAEKQSNFSKVHTYSENRSGKKVCSSSSGISSPCKSKMEGYLMSWA